MSNLERILAFHIHAAGLPKPEREYTFCPGRKWRFDFCWPDKMLAVECEGGIWTKGRHVRGVGFVKDCYKYNRAALLGWRVLRFTPCMIDIGQALNDIEEALG